MTKSDEIEHLTFMIRSNVYDCYHQNMSNGLGYLVRLEKIALQGGYATECTMEIMGLDRAESELRKLADEIAGIRNKLVANSKQKAA